MEAIRLKWEKRPALSSFDSEVFRNEWDHLNSHRGDLPFLSAEAVQIALRVLGDRREWVLMGRRGNELVAVFVLVAQDRFRWRTFQPSQIPLGVWVAHRDEELEALALSLLRGPLGFCLVLSVTQVDPSFAPRCPESPTVNTMDYIETGWIELVGNFDEYWGARGKNLRQNMRKQRNKLAADGVRSTFRVLTDPSDMGPALERYGDLEGRGWKAQQGTAISPDNLQGLFYRELLETHAARGEAVVYEYLFDDQTVAMNLCIFRQGVLIVLKTTYDESIKSLSPAFLLREEELRTLFEEQRVSRIEYYGRLMDWHTKLTDQKRMLYHLTVYRLQMVKRLAVARKARSAASGSNGSMLDESVPVT